MLGRVSVRLTVLNAIRTGNRCRAKPDRPRGRSRTDRDCAEYHNHIEMTDLSRRGLLKLSTGALAAVGERETGTKRMCRTNGLPATRRETGMMVTSSETPSPASSWKYPRTSPSSVCQYPTAREHPARQNETGWWAYLPPVDRLPPGFSDVFQRGERRDSAPLGARVQITGQEVASA